MAATWSSFQCQEPGCEKAGTVRWIRPLPGSWAVQNGMAGTAPATGQAYAALGAQLAAIGSGLTLSPHPASPGPRPWATHPPRVPPRAAATAVPGGPGAGPRRG